MTSLPAAPVNVDPSDRPLAGKRIVLTRPAAQAGDFEARVSALGGVAVLAPAIAIAPPESWTVLDAALRRIETYDWIAFTSVNAVRALAERAASLAIPADALRDRRLAAVGAATAVAIAGAIREPDIVASTSTGDALAREIPDVRERRVLFPHGDLAGTTLPDGLELRGAFVDRVVVYRTVPGPAVESIVGELKAGTIDALLFASASAVRFVADALARASERNDTPALQTASLARPAVICIGSLTADAARTAGFSPVATANSATMNDLVDRVAGWFAERSNDSKGPC